MDKTQFLISQGITTSLEGLVAVAAKADRGRPGLRQVAIDIKDFDAPSMGTRFTFTVTDSYRLAQQSFTIPAPLEGDPLANRRIVVAAKPLLESFKKIKGDAKFSTWTLPTIHAETGVVLEVGFKRDGVISKCEFEMTDYPFVKFEHFFSEQADGDLIEAFNPVYFAEIPAMLGLKGVAAKGAVVKMTQVPHDEGRNHNPVMLESKNTSLNLESRGLLMPVRL